MTDWSAILAQAFKTPVGKRGDTGDTGDKSAKALRRVANSSNAHGTRPPGEGVTGVTSLRSEFVTPVTLATVSCGDTRIKEIRTTVQAHRQPVTRVTPVTPESTSVGRCAIGRLRSMASPEYFSAETWRQLVIDAEIFFARWAERAELLAWSDTDLIGVHPGAPAARYDAMGLLLLLRGGEVLELHAHWARIRSQGGSSLMYRKCGYAGAVPLWEVGSA
jgi:hypothetical protein